MTESLSSNHVYLLAEGGSLPSSHQSISAAVRIASSRSTASIRFNPDRNFSACCPAGYLNSGLSLFATSTIKSPTSCGSSPSSTASATLPIRNSSKITVRRSFRIIRRYPVFASYFRTKYAGFNQGYLDAESWPLHNATLQTSLPGPIYWHNKSNQLHGLSFHLRMRP